MLGSESLRQFAYLAIGGLRHCFRNDSGYATAVSCQVDHFTCLGRRDYLGELVTGFADG